VPEIGTPWMLEDIPNISRSPGRKEGQTKRNFSLRMTEPSRFAYLRNLVKVQESQKLPEGESGQ